jgi:hypothetical protein
MGGVNQRIDSNINHRDTDQLTQTIISLFEFPMQDATPKERVAFLTPHTLFFFFCILNFTLIHYDLDVSLEFGSPNRTLGFT